MGGAPLSGPPRRRRSSAVLNHSRDEHGCIVTWRDRKGDEHVRHEPGLVHAAVQRIINEIPAGGTVRSISTPRTILRDLQNDPRTYGGGAKTRVDRYSVERQILSKIGRTDLLPEEAKV